jgi:hypothetical protein
MYIETLKNAKTKEGTTPLQVVLNKRTSKGETSNQATP